MYSLPFARDHLQGLPLINQELAKPERYLAVDSLRGIAALAVAFFHLYSPSFQNVNGAAISFLSSLFQFGYLGVPIFFVISGFVIAATLKPREVNFHYIGKFIVKRATRLDPPYWLSIATDISLVYLTIRLFHLPGELPSGAKILAHVFYLQNLLGMGDIAANYWTLCLEVQFYIFLSLIFACARKFEKSNQKTGQYFIAGVVVATIIFSLLIAANYVANPMPGLFLSHWYLFALGATCYWTAIPKHIGAGVFFSYCACAFLLFIVQAQQSMYVALNTLSALGTACFLYVTASRGKMAIWLNHRALLYLGSISYSLYLFHGIVGDRFISFMQKWLLPKFGLGINSSLSAILLFLAALGVSIAASHLVYWLIEKPSVKISKKIKPASNTSILSDARGGKIKSEYAAVN